MTYDPVKFCWGCRRPKPRSDFAPVKPGSTRSACSSCRALAQERKPIV